MERRKRELCPPSIASPCVQLLPPLFLFTKRSNNEYNQPTIIFSGISQILKFHLEYLIRSKDVETVLNKTRAVGPVKGTACEEKKLSLPSSPCGCYDSLALWGGAGVQTKNPASNLILPSAGILFHIENLLICNFESSPSHRKFSRGQGSAQLTERKKERKKERRASTRIESDMS